MLHIKKVSTIIHAFTVQIIEEDRKTGINYLFGQSNDTVGVVYLIFIYILHMSG